MNSDGVWARTSAFRLFVGALLLAVAAAPALAAKGNDKGNAWGVIKQGIPGNGAGRCDSTATPPTIEGWPTFTLMEGEVYSFQPTASDANCDSLSFSIAGKPSWASFDPATGALVGTPPVGSAGQYPDIVISVSDGTASSSLPRFSVTVYENHAPILTGTPPTRANSGQLYSFTPGVFDGDGQTLRFSIVNRPAWASFDAATGKLSGTPSDTDAGNFPGITISVTDGLLSDSLGPFGITVEAGNRAPSISGQPAVQVTAGQAYSFVPGASDPDGDTLRFSIANLPPWASFDTATGRLSGTPAESAIGEYIGITLSVSDGRESASLPTFSILVETENRAPVISGSPARAVTVGNAYRFVPSATDPDGDALSFRVVNKPSWATFNPATGELAGTPGSAAIGSYGNIQISVSDGQSTSALPVFSIAVEQSSSGSATLSWEPPTQRTDGSPLTDLAGYRIAYGTAPENLGQKVTLNNPGVTTYVLENLSQGTWYFAMTAFDSSGAESDYSSIGSKTIN
jgi:hypothetical protein